MHPFTTQTAFAELKDLYTDRKDGASSGAQTIVSDLRCN
jgi:hypothetical protein